MSKELKQCPFCGGGVRMDDEQITATITVDYFICEKCGATVHFEYADSTAETIEAWNTRKPIDDIVEQLEKLKEWGYAELMPCEVDELIDKSIEIVKGGAE